MDTTFISKSNDCSLLSFLKKEKLQKKILLIKHYVLQQYIDHIYVNYIMPACLGYKLHVIRDIRLCTSNLILKSEQLDHKQFRIMMSKHNREMIFKQMHHEMFFSLRFLHDINSSPI